MPTSDQRHVRSSTPERMAQRVLSVMIAAACAGLAIEARAQSAAPAAPPAGTLQTVTVTAERTTENIKAVPIAVTKLSGEKLDVINSGGGDVRVLSGRTPSLNIESSFGRAFPRFYIRGYGNPDFHVTASQPVSLVYDDVVQENPLLKGFPMFDLDAVEVLAGPQGTLFGRNTPAGVVKFDSVKPKIDGGVHGYGSIAFGTYKTTTGEAAVNIPINDEWAARVSGLYQYRDNYVDNTIPGPTQHYEGYNDRAVRAQALYKPGGTFSALFNVHGHDLKGSARLFRANLFPKGSNDLAPGFDVSKVALDGLNRQSIQTYGSSARLTWDIGQYNLYSITGYETVHTYSRGDIDGGYGPNAASLTGPGVAFFSSETAGAVHDHGQFTQEFRIESKYAGQLNWQAGLYYFNEKFISDSYTYDTANGGAQLGLPLSDHQKSTSWAGFGSVKYDVNADFSLRLGVRYTYDKKSLDSAPGRGANAGQGLSASFSSNKPTGDVSALYKLTPDTNVYARIASGYRAPTVQPASAFGVQSRSGQENTTSYEAGVKSDLWNRKARVSASVFKYNVHDLQLTEVGGQGLANTLKTAKRAEGQGVELNLDAYLTDNFLMTFSGSYNKTEIKDAALRVGACGGGCTVTNPQDASGTIIDGNPLPNAPKWVANATARYSIPAPDGEYFLYTDWSYRSKVNFFLYQSIEFTGKPLVEGGLRLGYLWHDGKYEAALFGRNITNKVIATGAIDFNNRTGFVNDPRTFGVQFKANF